MSKHSEKKTKVVENRYDHPQSYYQSYVPTPYIAATYEQPTVVIPHIQGTQIITAEPTVIRERRVVQGESQFIKQDHVIQEQNCCMPCMPCVPCCDKEQKVVTRQVVLKEKQPIVQNRNEDYERKLDEIEKLHLQEVREMELKMQQQLEQLQNQKVQDEQQRQLLDLKQSLFDIKHQLSQRGQQTQPQQQQTQIINPYQIEKLENQLDKKKKRIKELKQIINNIQIELQQKSSQIQDLDLRLRQPIPQQVVHVPVPQENYELINQVRYLEQERNALLREIDSLKFSNSELSSLSFREDPEKIRLKQDYTRMINDFRFLEQENIKMATIIGQKDELIKSLEQRISIELSRQSILLQQQSPQRVVLEQTTTTRPIQAQYVIDSSQSFPPQPIHKQYIIQDQPIQTIQPTLLQQQQQQQTLPNVKIIS
ncbi:unnamed protein product [Paramecium octaurelia]|uniref:Uncharacterized protein n=1 Tax=Paramecium octaurelia TaxID=43137 RepID=A0A8S1X0B4_PAROT|nr:unnamed protein product [Paramecium octaurelia]